MLNGYFGVKRFYGNPLDLSVSSPYKGHHCGPNFKKKPPTGKNTVSNNGVRFTFSYFKLVQSEHCIHWIECYDWPCFEYVNKTRAMYYDNKNLVSLPL